MFELIVAIGFGMIIASYHFIVDEFQLLLGSLAYYDFFVIFFSNDCGWKIASHITDSFTDRSARLLLIL